MQEIFNCNRIHHFDLLNLPSWLSTAKHTRKERHV
jgi:hypothetical protein